MSTRLQPPSDDEVVAIMAAIEVAWPKPVGDDPLPPENPWRFSGRWWSRPLTVRRDRPWLSYPAR
ncbi:MAG: hypothetical protein ACRDZY_04085 [Acidimicrobiales bacterium]